MVCWGQVDGSEQSRGDYYFWFHAPEEAGFKLFLFKFNAHFNMSGTQQLKHYLELLLLF